MTITLMCNDRKGYDALKRLFNTQPDSDDGEIGLMEIAKVWKVIKPMFMARVMKDD